MTDLKNIEMELEHLGEYHTLRSTPRLAKRFGELLQKAKSLLPHGSWSTWLRGRGIAPRTAQVWIQISKALASNPHRTAVSSLADVLHLERAGKEIELRERRAKLAVLDSGSSPENITLIHGSFEELANHTKPKSVSLAVVDPPYAKHELYKTSSLLVKNLLREGGLAMVYCLKPDIGKIITLMESELRFIHCLCVFYKSGGSRHHKFVTKWQPILLFQKGKGKIQSIQDAFMSIEMARDRVHEWSQDRGALRHYISRFTKSGETVIDLFNGGGTTALTCHELNRKCFATDIDETCIKATRHLLTLTGEGHGEEQTGSGRRTQKAKVGKSR